MTKIFQFLRITLTLIRFNLSIVVSISALVGFVVYRHALDWTALHTFAGVLLLSGAASALNQYQEREYDALMERTKGRPLPARELRPFQALIIVIVLGITGALVLFRVAWIAAALGAFNLIWYNAVYTPLKRKTSFAVLPGALTGALPPIIGWCAAGGFVFTPPVLFIAFFMFMWQIPHFLLLLLKYGREYEIAGFPSLSKRANETGIRRIIFVWLLGSAASSLLFPLFHMITKVPLNIILIAVNILWLLYFYAILFTKNKVVYYSSAFGAIYSYQGIVFILLTVQSLA